MQILSYCGLEEENFINACTVIDKLDKIGIDGVKNEFETLNYSQEFICLIIKALTEIREKGVDVLTAYGVEESLVLDMKELINIVQCQLSEGFKIEFDISIVRGQGYYTGSVFEMYSLETDFKGALGGGGRYDKMYEKFAGTSVPAVGYGLGLDRVLLVLNKINKESLYRSKKLALVYKKGEEITKILQFKEKLKKEYDVSIFSMPKNFREFVRRLKLNSYENIYWLDKQTIEKI